MVAVSVGPFCSHDFEIFCVNGDSVVMFSGLLLPHLMLQLLTSVLILLGEVAVVDAAGGSADGCHVASCKKIILIIFCIRHYFEVIKWN